MSQQEKNTTEEHCEIPEELHSSLGEEVQATTDRRELLK